MIIIGHADNSGIRFCTIHCTDRLQLLCSLLKCLLTAITASLGFPHAPVLLAGFATDHLLSPFTCKEINKFLLLWCMDQTQMCQIINIVQTIADHLCQKHTHIIGNHTFLRRIQIGNLFGLFESVTFCLQRCLHQKKFINYFHSAFLRIECRQSLDRHPAGNDRMKEFPI